jgi:hypothetical protein
MIMRDAGVPASTFSPAARAALRPLTAFFSPTHFHEEPIKKSGPLADRKVRSGTSIASDTATAPRSGTLSNVTNTT